MTGLDLPPYPTDELVTAAWIGTIPGLAPGMVDEVLPPDVEADGTVAGWVATGFVTVAVAGGNPDAALPTQKPVMQVDVWATDPGSNKPPWRKASAIGQAIVRATWDRQSIARPLPLVVNGVTYPTAVVKTAYITSNFRRMYDDAGDYAHLQGDLALEWVTVNERIP